MPVTTGRPAPVLMALHPRHIASILAGTKTVELRRRPPRQPPPYQAILYATASDRAVAAVVEVTMTLSLPPSALWERVGDVSGLRVAEFEAYFRGCQVATALCLGLVQRVEGVRWPAPHRSLGAIYEAMSGSTPAVAFDRKQAGYNLVVLEDLD
jgi:predicted transcriptional regulator